MPIDKSVQRHFYSNCVEIKLFDGNNIAENEENKMIFIRQKNIIILSVKQYKHIKKHGTKTKQK